LQPLSCRHEIVDAVIPPKQNGFFGDEGGHLPDFSIGTRAEPLPEGTRRSLRRGGAGGTDAEIGMQTTAERFERLFRAFEGQHGLRTVVMLETPTAIANAAEIAAVPGVDVLLIGTNNLCAEMGIPGDFGHDRVAEAYRAMIAGCKKHNKFQGMAGIYNGQIMPRYIDMGARFILSGQDAQFMLAGAAQRTGFLRKTFPGQTKQPPPRGEGG
jgi:hypothetical protein